MAHPNVVRVLHADGERLVTEWVEGADLGATLARTGPLPAALAVFVAREAARGLAAVHAAGVLHRDIAPANVLIGTDGGVKLTDFGLASLRDHADREVRGTMGTLAPEVVRGEAHAEAADLFGLGAVLAHAVAGRAPFARPDASGTLDAVLHADPAAALDADPRVPHPLADAARALLAKDPADRPASATDAADRLTAVLDTLGGADATALAAFLNDPAGYRPPSPPVVDTPAEPRPSEPSSPRPRRRRIAVGLTASLAAAVALAVFRFGGDDPRPVPSEPRAVAPVAVETAPAIPAQPDSKPLALDPPAVTSAPPPGAPPDRPETGAQNVTRSLPEPTPSVRAPPLPAPTTEPRPAPAEPRTGTLALAVEPWARVTVDGRAVGTTPLGALTLPAGEHEVRLVNPEFPPHAVRVQIAPGEATRTVVSLWETVGRVTLEVSPWARVTVDGREWDTVPPQSRPLVLPPGEHVLGFDHPTLGSREVRLQLSAGEQRTVRVRMGDG